MTLGSWSPETQPNTNTWRQVVYVASLNIYCAVADGGGAGRVMTSPDGITWTAHTISSDNFNDLIWVSSLGLFIAVGLPQANTAVSTSPDGVNWTVRSATAGNAGCVAWAPSLGYMVAPIRGSTTQIYKSTNGTTWTAVTCTGLSNLVTRIAWDAVRSQFIAITDAGTSATTSIYTSPDGVTWTARTAPNANQLFGLAIIDGGTYVATCLNGTNRVNVSTDGGVTWTAHASAVEATEWAAVCWDATDGVFIAVGEVGANANSIIMTSPDGITWTAKTAPENINFRGVTYGGGLAVAVGNTGTHRIAISASVTGGSVGSVNRTATVAGVGNAIKKSVGSAAGQATVAGHSGATKQAVGSASGHATVAGSSSIVHTGAGNAPGHATVQGVSAATKDSTFTIGGQSTVHGVGIASQTVAAVGTAAGHASVSGKSNNDKDAVGTASGHATVMGVGSSVINLKGLGQLFVLGYARASYDIFLRGLGLSLVAGDQKRVANARGIPLVSLKAQQSKTSLKANVQE